MTTTLAIDIETRSAANISKTGVYPYAADKHFQILLFAYSIDDGPVQIIDLTKETLPEEIIQMILEPTVLKFAFNAAFERVCLSRHLQQTGHMPPGQYLDPAAWRCTMVWASALGLPMSLKNVGAVLNIEKAKDPAGFNLIRTFCLPQPDQNAQPALFARSPFRDPAAYPDKWQEFKNYCVRDVEAEQEIRHRLQLLPLPQSVWDDYTVDQKINDRGILIDRHFAQQAVATSENITARLQKQARELTGLDNPNSPTQLLEWLAANGATLPDLQKATVASAADQATGKPRQMLKIRQELAKTSISKYTAMLAAQMPDGRAHGLIQYYGAGRTGRWAGRLVQVQNLPRNHTPILDEARQLVADGAGQMLDLFFASPQDALSQLIRTAFIPSQGKKFIVADYSAIEARVLAWLADEKSTLAAFRNGEDLYCATASKMFGVPVEKHGANADLRQKGKIAVLACGYGGGAGALEAMGALKMGLAEDELQPIVEAWRTANPNVVQFWQDIQQAALRAIAGKGPQTVGKIALAYKHKILQIQLPSGRVLYYQNATRGTNRWGGDSIEYHGMSTGNRWTQLETYGGKLVENVTQAVARDLLAYALANLEAAGYPVVMHIHDEAVVEAEKTTTVDEICRLMAKAPAWAAGLPMEADGYETPYYKKD